MSQADLANCSEQPGAQAHEQARGDDADGTADDAVVCNAEQQAGNLIDIVEREAAHEAADHAAQRAEEQALFFRLDEPHGKPNAQAHNRPANAPDKRHSKFVFCVR